MRSMGSSVRVALGYVPGADVPKGAGRSICIAVMLRLWLERCGKRHTPL